MNLKSFLSSLLIFAAACSCILAQDMRRYDFDLLSIEIPENWDVSVAEDEYGLFDAKDNDMSRYIVASQEKIDGVSLDSIFQKFVYNEDILLHNGTVLDTGSTTIDNTPAKWVIHFQDVDSKKILSINYLFLRNGRQIIIGGYALEKNFDQSKALFHKIVSSIDLK